MLLLGMNLKTFCKSEAFICLAILTIFVANGLGCSAMSRATARQNGAEWSASQLSPKMSSDTILSMYGKPSTVSRDGGMEIWRYDTGFNWRYSVLEAPLINTLYFSIDSGKSAELRFWDLLNIKSYEHPEFTLENTRKVELGMLPKDIRKLFGAPDGFYVDTYGQSTPSGPWLGLTFVYRMDVENPEYGTNTFIFSLEDGALGTINLDYIR